MPSHNDIGKEGEEWAVTWLVNNGYEILQRNWRHSYYEIDIVAIKNDKLHIIEVKTRKGTYLGYPEENVKKKKFRDLQRATDEFLFQNPGHQWLQYDILAIILKDGKEPEVFLLEDVYFS